MKKNFNSFDFIKQKFDDALIDTPESLSESNIKEKLNNISEEQADVKKAKRIRFKPLISAVASFMLIIATLTSFNALSGNTNAITGVKNKNFDAPTSVSTFSSYDEIYSYIKTADERAKKLEKKYSSVLIGGVSGNGEILYTGSNASVQSDGTYTQEENVNEADVVKKYGNYIFTHDHFDVLIYKTDNGSFELVAKADCGEYEFTNVESVVKDIYVSNGILAVNTIRRDKRYFSHDDLTADDPHLNYACCETVLKLFDISDPENPEFITQFVQSGDYETSRLIGNTEYIISNHYTSDFCDEAKTPYSITDKRENIDCSDISYMEDGNTSNCMIISAVDITSGEVYETKAVYGISHNIYCTTDNVYFSNYDTLGNGGTQIIKASIKNNTIEFTAQTKINGYILNQFSMNEKDGNLRVAITEGTVFNKTNSLYILDENLNVLSKTKNFANGENIKSVCFIGDTAYVITYEWIDPLFTIDLSNPLSPEIKGEVEITGFSSQLIPISKNTLLGIGTETITNEEGFIVSSGLKFALFDVSDPENPTVLDSIVLEDVSSRALHEHKAITINPEKGYIAIPVSNGLDKYGVTLSYEIVTLTINDGKLNITNTFNCLDAEDAVCIHDFRCVYIDDYIYAVADSKIDKSFYVE